MTTRSSTDQAEGLRRMFAHTRAVFVPVVANPSVAFSGVLLERLCAAFGERGANVLVVDAGESARPAGEMALVDLGQCIEALGGGTFFVAARGLPIRFVDSVGSTRACLQAVAEAAPYCDIVLVHASAAELARLYARRDGDSATTAKMPCAVVLADDRPASVTHAYAAMKLLARRADLLVFDLLLAAAAHSPRAERIAAKLSSCADDFFGAVLRVSARVDPAADVNEAPNAALRRLAAERLGAPTASACIPSLSPRTFGLAAEYATP